MIWLPYPDFRRSAKALSDDHLRLQRNAVREALRRLTIARSGPIHDWIAEWDGHTSQLLEVCEATLEERRRRNLDERGVTPWMLDHGDYPPDWLGNTHYHQNVKRQLLALDPKHYARMMWSIDDEPETGVRENADPETADGARDAEAAQ